MSRYHLSHQAEQDLNDLYDYIARSSAASAARLVQRIQQACRQVAQFPSLGTMRDDLRPGMRGFAVGNYVLFYEAADDGICILRILHGARNISSAHFNIP